MDYCRKILELNDTIYVKNCPRRQKIESLYELIAIATLEIERMESEA
jgi:hypothetical protein